MTAIRRRRTRSTALALTAAIVGLIAAAVLGRMGLETLADSTAGRAADVRDVELVQRLPFTSTALLGVADEEGRLTSLTVAVLESDGTGGSLVQIPVTADPSSLNADVSAPLSAVLANEGPIALREAIERLTGMSFDVIEIADAERFVAWITPLGDLPTDLPNPVADASSGQAWSAGEQSLSGPSAARLVTATDPAVEDWRFEPTRAALWSAIAGRIGAGIGSATAVAADDVLEVPATSDEFLERLFAGPVSSYALSFRPIEGDELSDRYDPDAHGLFDAVDALVVLDRAEMLMVFGGVAPSRLGAPLDAPSFRIVNPLTADDTEPLGLTPSDVTKAVVDILIFSKVNVISVVEAPGPSPEVTQVLVDDETTAERFAGVYEEFLGELDVSVADTDITGIDIEIVIGRSTLTAIDEGSPAAASDAARQDAGEQDPDDAAGE